MPRGRPKGSLNKVTKDVKIMAQRYTKEALNTLVTIMRSSESDKAKGSAATAILARGWGMPAQTVATTIKDERLVARMPAPAKDADAWIGEHAPPSEPKVH